MKNLPLPWGTFPNCRQSCYYNYPTQCRVTCKIWTLTFTATVRLTHLRKSLFVSIRSMFSWLSSTSFLSRTSNTSAISANFCQQTHIITGSHNQQHELLFTAQLLLLLSILEVMHLSGLFYLSVCHVNDWRRFGVAATPLDTSTVTPRWAQLVARLWEWCFGMYPVTQASSPVCEMSTGCWPRSSGSGSGKVGNHRSGTTLASSHASLTLWYIDLWAQWPKEIYTPLHFSKVFDSPL